MGPISKKVTAGLKKAKNKKIINFQELKEAKTHAENLDNTVISKEKLGEHDPLHAIYIYPQKKMSVLVEQLSELPAFIEIFGQLKSVIDMPLRKKLLNESYSLLDQLEMAENSGKSKK